MISNVSSSRGSIAVDSNSIREVRIPAEMALDFR